jgi:hypothetical protein
LDSVVVKIFKISVEGTIKAETSQDKMCTFGELMKETSKSFGLGKDAIFMNLLSEEYSKIDIAYYNTKDIWIGRQRFDMKPKMVRLLVLKFELKTLVLKQ